MSFKSESRRVTKQIANYTSIELVSDTDNGEILDTKVLFNGAALLWIAGNTIDDFVADFKALVEKYQI